MRLLNGCAKGWWGILLCAAALSIGCSESHEPSVELQAKEELGLRSLNVELTRENLRLRGENSALQAHVAQLQAQVQVLQERLESLSPAPGGVPGSD